MRNWLLLVMAVVLGSGELASQGRPSIVVQPFTIAPGVELPYDTKLMQAQLVAELKVLLKGFDVVPEPPAPPHGNVYVLDATVTGWRPGNAAKRLLIGLGSGREASDIEYRLVNESGQAVIEQKDTVRTNFYSQGSGSTGTLGHPIAQKIADRVKNAKLK